MRQSYAQARMRGPLVFSLFLRSITWDYYYSMETGMLDPCTYSASQVAATLRVKWSSVARIFHSK